jgi:predicted dehydrogenase
MSEKKLRVAVFGTGYWAKMQIPTWQAAGAQVVAAWNRTPEKARAVAEQFSIPHVYEGPQELFENADFDIADIIAGEEAHYPLVMMAAKYKKDVVCQKPMAHTFEECQEMVRACNEAGVWFAIHENHRYKNAFHQVKEILDSKILGRIFRAHIRIRSAKRERLHESPQLMAMDHMALRDIGPHIFDLSRFLFGEAITTYCSLTSTYTDIDVQNTAVAVLTMKNKIQILCEICNERKALVFISGENGTLFMDHNYRIIMNIAGNEQIIEPFASKKPAFITQKCWDYHGGECIISLRSCIEDLINSYEMKRPIGISADEYLKTMEIVFKSIQSSDENRVCQLELAD